MTLNKDTGDIVHAFGKNIFIQPHMVTLDAMDNIWVTDLITHMVYKFNATARSMENGLEPAPVLTLGEKVKNRSEILR